VEISAELASPCQFCRGTLAPHVTAFDGAMQVQECLVYDVEIEPSLSKLYQEDPT
jgi:hypothetical protein